MERTGRKRHATSLATRSGPPFTTTLAPGKDRDERTPLLFILVLAASFFVCPFSAFLAYMVLQRPANPWTSLAYVLLLLLAVHFPLVAWKSRQALAAGSARAPRVRLAARTLRTRDQRDFDASRVPESLRALSPWASRYGVGDDYCRPYLLKRLAGKHRAQLVRAVDRHATSIHAWLDTFAEGKMPSEAAAFMYLALAAEEIRGD